MNGKENWFFSRLGTHCLEKFFGLIRQGSPGDDRFIRAIRIIKTGTVMVHVLHELNLHPDIRGRDNIGGTIIGEGLPNFSQNYVDLLFRSLLVHASLHFDAPDELPLMNHQDLIEVLTDWCQNDDRHKTDRGHNADILGNIAGYVIVARIYRRGALSETPKPN
jgi:hypothetical protein